MTDQELITGIINRERTAIQCLVSTYHRQVIKTAYHFVQNMDDAEDIAQDVCIEIMESAIHFKGTASLSTWIYRVTVNKSLNFLRKHKRRQLVGQLETFLKTGNFVQAASITEPGAEDHSLSNEENRQILERAISQLPENQRIAFLLNKYDQMPYKQVAEIMNTSVASVESLLQRAKQNLQKKLVSHFSEYKSKK